MDNSRVRNIKHWAVGITTAPRKRCTLAQTLNSLKSAGWDFPRVFAEPDIEIPSEFNRLPVSRRDETLGAFPNWYLALTELVLRNPRAEAFLLCQDDVLFASDIRDYLELNLWPAKQVGVVSIYCPSHYPQAAKPGFIHENRGWDSWGALAYIFSNPSARAILSDSMVLNHRDFGPAEGLHHIDSVVGYWCERNQLPYYVHSPSLAQHIGESSTIYPKATTRGNRQAKDFQNQFELKTDLHKIAKAPPAEKIQHTPVPEKPASKKLVGIYTECAASKTDIVIKTALNAGYDVPVILQRVDGSRKVMNEISNYAKEFELIQVSSEAEAKGKLRDKFKKDVQIFNVWNCKEVKDKHGNYDPVTYQRAASKPMNPSKQPYVKPTFNYRNELGLYLNQMGLTGEIAEVGVFQCNFSQQIMKHWHGEKIHLIDIKFNKRQDIPRAEFHEMSSLEASRKFADASLDAVYIDADHSFYAISEDLEYWYDKVKPGGLFCGHDFINSYDIDVTGHQPVPLDHWPTRDVESLTYGVKVAVTRFARKRGLKIYHTAPDERGSPSWFIVKPHRFVTTLTENFIPGFIGLIQSMKENSEIDFCYTVVEYEPISQKQKDVVNAMGIKVDWYPKELLGHFEFDRAATDSPRMAWNLNKFLVWKLPHRGPMCYTDVDVLCLSSLRDLRYLRPLSVTMMQSAIGKEPDAMTQYRASGMYPFNAGWFVFERSEQIFNECQEYARSYNGQRIAFGDQVPMNDYWASQRPEQVNFVDINWNISHWCLHHENFNFNWDTVKLLHFAHAEKPWKDKPTHKWMEKGWDLFHGFYKRGILEANKSLKEGK